MRNLDPYAELDVPRDADDKAIRRAYRRRAKTTHPDSGGDREAFERANQSLIILIDPVRRERFDRTGSTDTAPDNTEGEALSQIAAMLDQILAGNRDPRTCDIIAMMKDTTTKARANCRGEASKIDGVITALKALRERFGTTDGGQNPAHAIIDGKIRNASQRKAALEHELEVIERAQRIVGRMTYRWDQPAQTMMFTQFGAGQSSSTTANW